MILQFYDFGEIGKFPFLSNVLATNISKNVVIIEIKKARKYVVRRNVKCTNFIRKNAIR
jgi:hypothetical protein